MEEATGDEFCAKAFKVLNTTDYWFFGPSRADKTNTAIEHYISATVQYKIAKSYYKAATAFTSAADLQLGGKYGNYYAATNYALAAENFAKVDTSKAKIYLEKSISLFLHDGKFLTAAKYSEMLADINLETSCITEAITQYERSADYYEADKSMVASNKCLLKAAYILIDDKQYTKALINLEKNANYYATSSYNHKCPEYFFEIIVIKMHQGDIVECKKLLDKYQNIDRFNKSQENKALSEMINAHENYDQERFSEAVTDYDSNKQLAPWLVNLILLIRDKITEDENAEDDLT